MIGVSTAMCFSLSSLVIATAVMNLLQLATCIRTVVDHECRPVVRCLCPVPLARVDRTPMLVQPHDVAGDLVLEHGMNMVPKPATSR